ncbi:MAG: trigger factor [Chloroflexota bacterium]|nr:MAG: trigger factor [Chloroflexota bacterium]
MSFTVTTEPRENRQLAVTIEVSKEVVDKELRKAAAAVASQYRIPGFRKGKAPYHIVVQQVGLSNLYSEFIDELGQRVFREAIEQEKIEPYAQSSLEDIQLEPLVYKLIVPLEPVVRLGDYRSLRVEEEPIEVDTNEVEQRLEMYRDEYAGWQEVERPSQFGDLLTVNVRSVIIPDSDDENGDNAEEIVVLDETDWEITLDEENPMEPAGFDRELIGMRAGEEKEFVVEWPADTQSIYAGKRARFHVEVTSVEGYEKPELDDDFAKLVGPDYETIDDLRNAIVESLQNEKRNAARSSYINKVLDRLVEISELDYPPAVIEDQLDGMVRDMDQRLRRMGLGEGLEGYLRMINQSEEDYRESLRSEASKLALRNLVLSEVIKQEGIEATDDDIEEHIKQLVGVDENGEILESAVELANMLRFGGGRSLVVSQVLSSKAVDFLVALARGEEPPSPAAKSESSAAEATNMDEVSGSSTDAIDNSETEEKSE